MLQRAESGREMAIFKIIFLLGEKTSKIQQHPLSLRDNLTPSVLHLQRQPPNP
jgi:hypothetical protein